MALVMAFPAAAGRTNTVAVIQPSFVPWRGYFDLIRRSDVFVFYDDVQYDKHGWRNRNRIKTPQGVQWLTIPVRAKGNTVERLAINEIEIDYSRDWRRAHLQLLRHAYHKAPYYDRYAGLLESLYAQAGPSLCEFTMASTIALARTLGIERTQFVRSSQFQTHGAKTERLLSLLEHASTKHYISGPSARAYIDADMFAQAGITLEYATYDYAPYEQLYPPYEGAVSILDLLFMTGPGALQHLVSRAAAGSITE